MGRKKYALIWWVNSSFKDIVELSTFPAKQRTLNAISDLTWKDHKTGKETKSTAKILSISEDRIALGNISVTDQGQIADPQTKLFSKQIIEERKTSNQQNKMIKNISKSNKRHFENSLKNETSIVPDLVLSRKKKKIGDSTCSFTTYPCVAEGDPSTNLLEQMPRTHLYSQTPSSFPQHNMIMHQSHHQPSSNSSAHMPMSFLQPSSGYTHPNSMQLMGTPNSMPSSDATKILPIPKIKTGDESRSSLAFHNVDESQLLTNWPEQMPTRYSYSQPSASFPQHMSTQQANFQLLVSSPPQTPMYNFQPSTSSYQQTTIMQSSDSSRIQEKSLTERNEQLTIEMNLPAHKNKNMNSSSINKYTTEPMSVHQKTFISEKKSVSKEAKLNNVLQQDSSDEDSCSSSENDENWSGALNAMAATFPFKVTAKDIAIQEFLLAAMKESYKSSYPAEKNGKTFELPVRFLQPASNMKEIHPNCGFYLPENIIAYINSKIETDLDLRDNKKWKILVREVLLEVYGHTISNYSAKGKQGKRPSVNPILLKGLFHWACETSPNLEKKEFIQYINKFAHNKRRYKLSLQSSSSKQSKKVKGGKQITEQLEAERTEENTDVADQKAGKEITDHLEAERTEEHINVVDKTEETVNAWMPKNIDGFENEKDHSDEEDWSKTFTSL